MGSVFGLDSGGDSGWVYGDDAPVFEDVLSHAGLREGRLLGWGMLGDGLRLRLIMLLVGVRYL